MINIKSKKKLSVLMLVAILVMTMTPIAFASNIDPGVKVGDWVLRNVQGLFIGVVAFFGILALVKRSLMQGITLILFAGLGAAFVYGGSDLGQSIGTLISSWFK